MIISWSMIRTFEQLGYEIIKIEEIHKSKNKKIKWFNRFSFGKFDAIAYLQFAVVAEPKR